MARQRPIAGERNRARLGADVPEVPAVPVEPAEVAAERPSAAPRRSDPKLVLVLALAGVLALALVVLALTAGLLAVRSRADDRVEQARTQARTAAESHAVTLLSYDHRHLDGDFAEAKKILTGGFADDYASTTEEVVRPTALEVKAVVTAEVASSSVVRAGENRAVVLLFVDQTTTSTRLEGPRVDLTRVRMTLDRTDGQWLVSGVDAL